MRHARRNRACWPPGSACARRLLAQPRDALSPVAAQEFRHVCGHTATSWGDASTKHVRPSSVTSCQSDLRLRTPVHAQKRLLWCDNWSETRLRVTRAARHGACAREAPHSAAVRVETTRGTSFFLGKKQGMQNLTGFGGGFFASREIFRCF
jgi:hypothetical protein